MEKTTKKTKRELMERTKKELYYLGLALVVTGAIDGAQTIGGFIYGLFNDNPDKTLSELDPATVRWMGVVVLILGLALILVQVAIGAKGMRVSKAPTADKGYIKAAKVFLGIYAVLAVTYLPSLFAIKESISFSEHILPFILVTVDAVLYWLFVKRAKLVRQSVAKGKK